MTMTEGRPWWIRTGGYTFRKAGYCPACLLEELADHGWDTGTEDDVDLIAERLNEAGGRVDDCGWGSDPIGWLTFPGIEIDRDLPECSRCHEELT